MASLNETRVETDVLVVGTGGAGCFAALKAHDRGARVTVLNKVPWLGGCTILAHGGYSAALGTSDPRDTPDIHLRDSILGGDYIGNQKVVGTMCRKSVDATTDLIQWGAGLKKKPDRQLDQGKEPNPGHTYPRRVVGDPSKIGKAIMRVLQTEMKQRNIDVLSNVMLTKVLTSKGKITGAVGLNWRDGTLVVFNAKTLIMATGGTGHLYKYTDNPAYITGDGYAIMYQAGAELVDMEFCDFQLGVYYPPQMAGYPPNWGAWIEHGGSILNRNSERFFKKYAPHRASEVGCLRTEINRAAAWEILEGRGSPHGMVYLNCASVPKDWMMNVRKETFSHFQRAGIDLTWQPMEIAPGNHTNLGGLRIDENGESMTIKGLYAAGEAAGGWGGSNRLWGNAVSAAMGLGIAAAESASERCKQIPLPEVDEKQVAAERERIQELLDRKKGLRADKLRSRAQDLMQRNVWLKRDERGLKTTLTELKKIEEKDLKKLCIPQGRDKQRFLWLKEALEAMNLLVCAQIVTTAALTRKESRGSHQRSDYPDMNNRKWLKNIIVSRAKGRMRVRTQPVIATEVPLPEE